MENQLSISIGDLLDRKSILLLKQERQPDVDVMEESTALTKAIGDYLALGNEQASFIGIKLLALKEQNGMIWDRESAIRQGKEKELGLEEVGRRAIEIRDINEVRVGLKNEVNSYFGTGFQETKHTWKK